MFFKSVGVAVLCGLWALEWQNGPKNLRCAFVSKIWLEYVYFI